MNRRFLELAAASALTLGAILASAADARASDISVKAAFARASATLTSKTGAVYFTIVNAGAEDRLTKVATPAASSAMIHAMAETNGIAKMSDMDGIEVPAGGTVALAPGKTHIMLMGLKAPLKKGGTLHLSLTFEKAGVIEADIPIASVAAMTP